MMKRFSAAILIAACSTAAGGAAEPAPPLAALWLPGPSSDWEGMASVFSLRPELRLSIAVDPAALAPSARQAMESWLREGRAEAVLRPAGDPILPLLARRRPSAARQTIAVSREAHRAAFGSAPSGLAPGAGAVSPDMLPTLASLGLRWAAVGDYHSSTWTVADRLVLVATARPEAGAPGPEAAGRVIGESHRATAWRLDESSKAVDAARILEAAALAGAGRTWTTVGGLVDALLASTTAQVRSVPSSGVPGRAPWPAWESVEASFDGSADRVEAWTRLDTAFAAFDRYQNSGVAQLRSLDKAATSLRAAQASRFFGDPALHRAEFHDLLAAAYRAIGERPPLDLQPSLAPSSARTGQLPEAQDASVGVSTAPGRIVFENASSPAGLPPLGPAGGAPAFDELRRLEARWGSDFLVIEVRLAPKNPSAPDARSFDEAAVDLYIDLNGRAGLGSASLLPGRQAFVRASDAWEYALVLRRSGGALYRHGPQGPAIVEKLAVESALADGLLSVKIPRAKLPGGPEGWGYLAVLWAADASGRPRPGPYGIPVLSALASSDDQARLKRRDPGFVRLPLQRAGR